MCRIPEAAGAKDCKNSRASRTVEGMGGRRNDVGGAVIAIVGCAIVDNAP